MSTSAVPRWQTYERIKTGETVMFKRTRPGHYERQDGQQFTRERLDKYYEYVSGGNRGLHHPKYVVNHHGFKIRVTKFQRRNNEKTDIQRRPSGAHGSVRDSGTEANGHLFDRVPAVADNGHGDPVTCAPDCYTCADCPCECHTR